jgi:hypothetical protein
MYVYPTSNMVVGYDGGRVHLNTDQVWAGDDPFVKARPELFTSIPANVLRTTAPVVIEQATAAPGEVRKTARRGKD